MLVRGAAYGARARGRCAVRAHLRKRRRGVPMRAPGISGSRSGSDEGRERRDARSPRKAPRRRDRAHTRVGSPHARPSYPAWMAHRARGAERKSRRARRVGLRCFAFRICRRGARRHASACDMHPRASTPRRLMSVLLSFRLRPLLSPNAMRRA
ncbi:hypothetical protein BP1026B_I0362 [Burkholderia pseudomallei 1026b]|uniref:Uncharacterized protein n=1 Tax=Burkholderia pseudomallei (strain 1026b) TaxID=884204 RepID=A0A0H3HEQ0_BURP2|nr:hypothetical protein BP1026B_I0362 [Burkholderia pseudomallei 1026b]EIF53295.1 hypothetical protein BP1026A_5710 [Burkholderia pseudomallei 1026a]